MLPASSADNRRSLVSSRTVRARGRGAQIGRPGRGPAGRPRCRGGFRRSPTPSGPVMLEYPAWISTSRSLSNVLNEVDARLRAETAPGPHVADRVQRARRRPQRRPPGRQADPARRPPGPRQDHAGAPGGAQRRALGPRTSCYFSYEHDAQSILDRGSLERRQIGGAERPPGGEPGARPAGLRGRRRRHRRRSPTGSTTSAARSRRSSGSSGVRRPAACCTAPAATPRT